MFQKLVPYDIAYLILRGYFKYYHQFKHITRRARIRFESKDWYGLQQDAKERIRLYRTVVNETTTQIRTVIQKAEDNPNMWQTVKQSYGYDIANFNTRNIAETFYNSIFRHYHKGLSADEECMFVHATGTYREFKSRLPICYTFTFTSPLSTTITQVMDCFPYDIPYANLERDIEYICKTLENQFSLAELTAPTTKLQIFKSAFYRNKAAYIVGRLIVADQPYPFIMPLLHGDEGIFVDTLLLDVNEVSSIFSYHRSYFLVQIDIPSETVDFLQSIMPTKGVDELYNSIGFEKHGKTVFYRDFLRHLSKHEGQFITAPGIRGMVMLVFTLPSYNMVFKLIRDKFAPPKNVTEAEVKEKYELVNRHDRVGRMADSHPFEHLVFERSRFSESLLEELIAEASSKITLTENTIEIKHLYVEKKMIPLNMYLEDATLQEAEEAINEYGKAIKQLAAVNIFPGDMLLKNFGVTRLRRVVFYDYDEIGFLTDYNFRIIPEPRNDYEEMSSEPWYHVGPNDIFPEEFVRFLIGNREIRQLFYKHHGDLYEVHYWKNIQKRLRAGEIIHVFPYRTRLRFSHVFKEEKVSQ